MGAPEICGWFSVLGGYSGKYNKASAKVLALPGLYSMSKSYPCRSYIQRAIILPLVVILLFYIFDCCVVCPNDVL